jgi:hypothetical protein
MCIIAFALLLKFRRGRRGGGGEGEGEGDERLAVDVSKLDIEQR